MPILPAPIALQDDAIEFRRWLLQEVERLRADCLCVDAFPAGILGELCDFHAPLAFWHVARLLRWTEYAPLIHGTPPRFARAWRLEELGAEQQRFLDARCDRIGELELRDAPGAEPVQANAPFWLVVHSGPESEVAELIAFAAEVRTAEASDAALWVASPQAPAALPARSRVLDVFPAEAYFAAAQRIFSAAGFNIMRQTVPYRAKHTVLPMPRHFDDQFERARRAFAHRQGQQGGV
jgi:predicted glycosyltransferase